MERPTLPVFDPLGVIEKLTEGAPIQLKDPIRQMFKSSSNPCEIPGAKVPGGRYTELPEVCRCQECGYEWHNPSVHCPQLTKCPQCGATGRVFWRVK